MSKTNITDSTRAAASRANGALSQGPVTAEGKQKSSRNALKHGLTAKQLLRPGETEEEYNAELAVVIEHYQPATDYEMKLVQDIAAIQWRLRRVPVYESSLCENGFDGLAMHRLIRYETTMNRQLVHLEKRLEGLRYSRESKAKWAKREADEAAAAVAAEIASREKLVLRQQVAEAETEAARLKWLTGPFCSQDNEAGRLGRAAYTKPEDFVPAPAAEPLAAPAEPTTEVRKAA